jgi:hypothetical protein
MRRHEVSDSLNLNGRRIKRLDVLTNAWQRYTHDGAEARSEENSDGSWVSYVNGDEMDDHIMLRRRTPGSPIVDEYYLNDHQGTVRKLADASGNVVNGNTFDTFGNRSRVAVTRLGYTGR